MAEFDVEGARRAGYSDAEIADHLAKERGFDAAGARRSGYSDAEIVAHLRAPLARPAADPAVEQARREQEGPLSSLSAFRRGVERAITLGFRDEIGAGIDAAVGTVFPNSGSFGERYDRALGRLRASDKAYEQDHPVATVAGNVTGGVLLPNPAPGAAGPMAGLVEQGLRSLPVRAAVSGGLSGAATGFGEGEGGFGNRLAAAGTGGALGAAGGAALATGVNAGAQIAGRTLHALGLRNPEVAADRQILRALERDGLDVANLGRPTAGPGLPPQSPDATLADLGGRNLVNLTAVAANTPGAAMSRADELVQARRAARPERIAGAVDEAFGGGGGTRVAEEVAALQQARSTTAAPLYRDAFDTPVTPEQFAQVERFMADPIGQEALDRGMRVIQLEHLARGAAFDPATFGVTRGQDGRWVAAEGVTPNMRLLDAVKRGFDEIVEGFRDPTSGRLNLNQYGRAVNDARATYRDTLAGEVPVYGDALRAWSGPSQSLDALAQGRQAPRLDRDVVAGIAQRLSPGDMEFFRLGMGRAITDATSDPRNAASYARRLVEDRQMQARLATAIPDPAQRAQFTAAMQEVVNRAAVDAAVSPRANSHTRRLEAGAEDMGQDAPGGVMASLLLSGPVGAARQAAAGLYRRAQGINPATADALAQRLLTPDAGANAATIARLEALRGRDLADAELRRGLAARLLQGMGAAGGLAAN